MKPVWNFNVEGKSTCTGIELDWEEIKVLYSFHQPEPKLSVPQGIKLRKIIMGFGDAITRREE